MTENLTFQELKSQLTQGIKDLHLVSLYNSLIDCYEKLGYTPAESLRNFVELIEKSNV